MTVLSALAVSSCGRNAELRTEPTAPATGAPVWVDQKCPADAGGWSMPGSPAKRGGIPTDFVTTSVLRCKVEPRDLPGKGQWLVLITEKADAPATDLMAELRRPSEPQTTNPCTADAIIPPYFLLIDAAGKALLPEIPVDSCGKPRIEARKALDALPFKVVSETPQSQIQSQGAVDSGCSMSWKDEIAIEAASLKPGPAQPLWPAPVKTVRVCVYNRISGGDLPVGQFVSGHTIDGAKLTTLDKVGPAAPCSAPHTKIATLHAESAKWATAELDGCLRLLRTDRSLGQLDAAMVAELLAK